MTEEDIKQLGEEAIMALAESRAAKVKPSAFAQVYITTILARQPDAKLPELLVLPATMLLMEKLGVTEAHLKEALTAARAVRKAQPADMIKVPRKRRFKTSPVQAPAVEQQPVVIRGDLLAGIVSDTPIDAL